MVGLLLIMGILLLGSQILYFWLAAGRKHFWECGAPVEMAGKPSPSPPPPPPPPHPPPCSPPRLRADWLWWKAPQMRSDTCNQDSLRWGLPTVWATVCVCVCGTDGATVCVCVEQTEQQCVWTRRSNSVCVSVCVCVEQKEIQCVSVSAWNRWSNSVCGTEWATVCVCVCVCVRACVSVCVCVCVRPAGLSKWRHVSVSRTHSSLQNVWQSVAREPGHWSYWSRTHSLTHTHTHIHTLTQAWRTHTHTQTHTFHSRPALLQPIVSTAAPGWHHDPELANHNVNQHKPGVQTQRAH